jgi:hypothetical protein
MNTANLQLQGVLTAMAELLRAMEAKGVLSGAEIEAALSRAEREAAAGAGQREGLSHAHVEAACFPARYLRTALSGTADERDFATVVATVGGRKA